MSASAAGKRAVNARLERTLRLAAFLVVAGLATKIYLGPTVVVHVVAADLTTPVAGLRVMLWNHHGVVTAESDHTGRAVFRRIRQRSGWVPSLGPGDGPPPSLFSIEIMTPVRGHHCPSIRTEVMPLRFWIPQTVELTIPPRATIEVDTSDPRLPAGRQRYLKLEMEGLTRSPNIDARADWCVWAGEELQVSLEVDSRVICEWPDLIPAAGAQVALRLDDTYCPE